MIRYRDGREQPDTAPKHLDDGQLVFELRDGQLVLVAHDPTKPYPTALRERTEREEPTSGSRWWRLLRRDPEE